MIHKIRPLFKEVGERVFKFLSGCEERNLFPRTSRWLKLALLAPVAALISQTIENPPHMCYAPAPMPDIAVEEKFVSPNPTEGADSVTVKVKAKITREGYAEGISKAYLQLMTDTTVVPMLPLDGEVGDTIEEFYARLHVGEIEACTTWISLYVHAEPYGSVMDWIELVVTDDETSEE